MSSIARLAAQVGLPVVNDIGANSERQYQPQGKDRGKSWIEFFGPRNLTIGGLWLQNGRVRLFLQLLDACAWRGNLERSLDIRIGLSRPGNPKFGPGHAVLKLGGK